MQDNGEQMKPKQLVVWMALGGLALAAEPYPVSVESNVAVKMRDGVVLRADIYRPRQDGRFPVLLQRTPYGKRGEADFGRTAAADGFVVVVQDTRGRYASEGEWYPFLHESDDGYDTVEWLAAQPWADGQVGTMGGSYCGSDQSALATLNPPHLKTMIVAVGASSYYHASMRQNGALELRFMIYAFRMATTSQAASRRSPGTASQTSTTAAATPGQSRRTASISPGSMRKPRTFTWLSTRPRNSIAPSGSQRTRSPVRYSREPASPNGSGTSFSALRSGRFQYPWARPSPPSSSSPGMPVAAGRSPPSTM